MDRFVGPACRVCGRVDKFDFKVPDRLWTQVVPAEYVSGVVCIACFDRFAADSGADYTEAIGTLYFAGEAACFEFRRIWGRTTYEL